MPEVDSIGYLRLSDGSEAGPPTGGLVRLGVTAWGPGPQAGERSRGSSTRQVWHYQKVRHPGQHTTPNMLYCFVHQ